MVAGAKLQPPEPQLGPGCGHNGCGHYDDCPLHSCTLLTGSSPHPRFLICIVPQVKIKRILKRSPEQHA